MNDNTARLENTLEHLKSVHRWQVRKLVWVRTLWLAIVAGLALIVADLLFAFGESPRILLDAIFFVVLVAVAVFTRRRYSRAASTERMVARMIEQHHPELQNELINAIDFSETLKQSVQPQMSQDLMNAEITRAAEQAGQVPASEPLKPPSLRREKVLLMGSAALLLVSFAIFSDAFTSILPRYIDPYGDHPPFSLTKLQVDPAGASVKYGQNLKVTVTAGGERPKTISLVLLDAQGREAAELPMFEAGQDSYFQTIERVREDMRYFIRIPRSRSKRYPLTVIKTPSIESVVVTYAFPAYTHLPQETRLLSEPKIKAYEGTDVTLTFSSNRPLKGGQLVVAGSTHALQTQKEPQKASVTFKLVKAGDFSASLTDVEGNESHEKLTGKVEVIPDLKPEISIVSPGMDSFAIPTAKIPVVIEAGDDLGITRLELVRNHNDSPDARKALFTGDGREKNLNMVEVLDLRDLGVKPGDVIDYYAAVTDSHPNPPQTASSPSFRLKIISFQEYREFMQAHQTADQLSQKYDKLLEKIEALANEQERLEKKIRDLKKKLEETGSLSKEEQEELLNAMVKQGELAKKTEKLSKELKEESETPGIYDVEDEYKQMLKEFSKRLAEAKENMERSAQRMREGQEGSGDPKKGAPSLGLSLTEQKEALEKLGRSRDEFRQGIQETNKDIEKIMKLLEDVEMFKALLAMQKELVRQARTYKDLKDPSLDERIRLKELEKEQEEIQKALTKLKENLRKHAEEVEDEFPKVAEDAFRIADEIEEREIEGLMKGASGKFGVPKAPEGYADALKAYEQMLAMVQFVEGMSGRGQSECEMRLKIIMGKSLGGTLPQLSKGSGMGQGRFGPMGRGSSGQSGGQTPFGMFGTEQMGTKTKDSSAGGRKSHESRPSAHKQDPRAGSIEELTTPKRTDREFKSDGGERFMDEYRKLIEEYFKGLAEEE